MEQELHLKGTAVSPGIVIGVACFLSSSSLEGRIPAFPITLGKVEREVDRYRGALASSQRELQQLQSHLEEKGEASEGAIVGAHRKMLEDPLITQGIEDKIRLMQCNTESVFRSAVDEYKKRLTNTIHERLWSDLTDLEMRIMKHLIPRSVSKWPTIPFGSIVFAKEVLPTEVITADPDRVLGFVTELGGGSSHAALIAKARGIPFASDMESACLEHWSGKAVILDGAQGIVIFNPSEETLQTYQHKCSEQKKHSIATPGDCGTVQMKGGTQVSFWGNGGALEDVRAVHRWGLNGFGLFRSEEFLLKHPSKELAEEELFAFYKALVSELEGLPVVIRVFDIGGDKVPAQFAAYQKEVSSPLGLRGIRFLLKYPHLFKMQLRSLLRASAFGPIKLLLPMVAEVEELKKAKQLLDEMTQEIGVVPLALGCMLEVPSACLLVPELAQYCDFFSIGTNDLIQYLFAADRTLLGERQQALSTNPSLLLLMRHAVTAAQQRGKEISVCGDMASHPTFLPLLIGMGIREFSCVPASVFSLKQVVQELEASTCEALLDQTLRKRSFQW